MNSHQFNCATNSSFIGNNKSANDGPIKKQEQSNPRVEELRNTIHFVLHANGENQLKNAIHLVLHANGGNLDAQNILGRMYLLGQDGVKKNLVVALFWFLQAAKQGCSEAQYVVGGLYCANTKIDNFKNAFRWTRAATLQGHKDAKEKLKELRKFALDKLAKSDHQYLDALLKIEKFYQEQAGFPINRKKTFEEFEQAAEQDSAEAQYQLGLIYLQGEVVAQDSLKAFAWIKKADVTGHPGAKSILDRMVDRIFK